MISEIYTRYDDAVISADELYRYALNRRWDQDDLLANTWAPPLVVDMLNPSKADKKKNDQTIDRLNSYATRLGCGGIIVVNLYAFRATDPNDLQRRWRDGIDIVGPENLAYVEHAYQLAKAGTGYVLAAWGGAGAPGKRDRVADHCRIAREVGVGFRTLLASPTGDPCHPLVRRKVHPEPVPWSPPTLLTRVGQLAEGPRVTFIKEEP